MDYAARFKGMQLRTLRKIKKNAEHAISRPGSRFYQRCLDAHPFICGEIDRRTVGRR